MIARFIRGNGILLATFGVYAALVVGFSWALDVLVFQERKKAIIFNYENNPPRLFPGALQVFLERLSLWRLELLEGRADGPWFEKLAEEAQALVRGQTSIYRLTLRDGQGRVLFESEADKFRTFNDWSNSLWLRRLTLKSTLLLSDPADPDRAVGSYIMQFTTPGGLPEGVALEITRLTRRWRMLNLAVAAILGLALGLFAKRILLPMRNVIESVEASRGGRTGLIARPRSRLETAYNAMARDAVLARLHERLNERIHGARPLTSWDLVAAALDFLVDQRAAAAAVVVELVEEGPGRWRWTGRARGKAAPGAGRLDDATSTGRLLAERLTAGASPQEANQPESEHGAAGAKTDASGPLDPARRPSPAPPVEGGAEALRAPAATGRLDDPGRPGAHYGLGLWLQPGSSAEEILSAQALAERWAAVVARALEMQVARARTLDRERGRASINLSRNLGHDLTNIIARSKLDLMTLKALLANGSLPPEADRARLLDETLEGLLDTTRFLQEVVNLYRAYAYLEEPALETLRINELVDETVRLFRLSTSEKAQFVLQLDPRDPATRVDPRLIKLALFNLFTNAIEAIRRSPARETAEARIVVRTAPGPDESLRLVVEDTGTGILTPDGRRADPDEIQRIFTLGVSLKAKGEGEGLGLHWVRTIVQDLHGGSIRAENVPGGGARFTLEFPPPETPVAPSAPPDAHRRESGANKERTPP